MPRWCPRSATTRKFYQRFRVINKLSAGAVTGTFGGLAEGAIVNVSGVRLRVSYIEFHNDTSVPPTPGQFYGNGNDVSLTVMTPPILVSTSVNGDITIDGTGWNDDITLVFTGTNSLSIIGNDVSNFYGPGTGNSQLTRPSIVTGDIKVNLGNGKDKVLIRGVGGAAVYDSGNLTIDLGSDDDAVTTIDTAAVPIITTGLRMTGQPVDHRWYRDRQCDPGQCNGDRYPDGAQPDRRHGCRSGCSQPDDQPGWPDGQRQCDADEWRCWKPDRGPGCQRRQQCHRQPDRQSDSSATGYAVTIHDTNVGGFVQVTNGNGSGNATVLIDSDVAKTIGGSLTVTNGNNVVNSTTLDGTDGLTVGGNLTLKNGNATTSNGMTITSLTNSGTTHSQFTNGSSPANTITFNGTTGNSFLRNIGHQRGQLGDEDLHQRDSVVLSQGDQPDERHCDDFQRCRRGWCRWDSPGQRDGEPGDRQRCSRRYRCRYRQPDDAGGQHGRQCDDQQRGQRCRWHDGHVRGSRVELDLGQRPDHQPDFDRIAVVVMDRTTINGQTVDEHLERRGG